MDKSEILNIELTEMKKSLKESIKIGEIRDYLSNRLDKLHDLRKQELEVLKKLKSNYIKEDALKWSDLSNAGLQFQYEMLMRLWDELQFLEDSPKSRELWRDYNKCLQSYNEEILQRNNLFAEAERLLIKEGKMKLSDAIYIKLVENKK